MIYKNIYDFDLVDDYEYNRFCNGPKEAFSHPDVLILHVCNSVEMNGFKGYWYTQIDDFDKILKMVRKNRGILFKNKESFI